MSFPRWKNGRATVNGSRGHRIPTAVRETGETTSEEKGTGTPSEKAVSPGEIAGTAEWRTSGELN